MSTENITAFFTKLQTDSELADKVTLATAQALADLAAKEGLPFTAEEFLTGQAASLSDADLEAVSGGGDRIINTFFGGKMLVQDRRLGNAPSSGNP